MKFQQAAPAALGITTISFGWVLVQLLDPKHMALYHWFHSSSLFYLPAVVDFLLVWLLFTMLILATDGSRIWRVVFWAAVVSFTPRVLMKSFAMGGYLRYPHLVGLGVLALGCVCFLVLCWFGTIGKVDTRRPIHVFRTIYAVLGLSGALFLVKASWYCYAARDLNEGQLTAKSSTAPTQVSSRVVWIIFDELSFQQVFEERFPDLKLRAFDALASDSAVFTQVVPAGYLTEQVVPSIFTGRTVDDIRATSAGIPRLHYRDVGTWEHLDPSSTIFSDALGRGYSTYLIGWWNPYCRVLSSVLNYCFTGSHADNGPFFRSFLDRMSKPLLAPFGSTPPKATNHREFFPNGRQEHIDLLGSVMAETDVVLRNPAATFTFIHLPVPHPPGIFDRRTSALSNEHGTYIDNLALADRCLQNIVQNLKETGQWDSVVLVIMGDHSWRPKMWNDSTEWTVEEDRASHGSQFDPRPVYIVRFPGQRAGLKITSPFEAIRTRRLFDQIMAGQIRTAEELRSWVQTAR